VSWAAAITAWAQLLVVTALVERAERFGAGAWWRSTAKVWLAAGAGTAAAYALLSWLPLGVGWFAQVARLAIGSAALVTAYAGLGAWLRLPELDALRRRLRRGR